MNVPNFIISRDDIMIKAADIEAANHCLQLKYKYDHIKIKEDKNWYAINALNSAKTDGTNVEFLGVNMTLISPEFNSEAKILEKWLDKLELRYTKYYR